MGRAWVCVGIPYQDMKTTLLKKIKKEIEDKDEFKKVIVNIESTYGRYVEGKARR